MSEAFLTSNGVEVSREGGNMVLRGDLHTDYLYEEHEPALREFFQHERDETLGRWRWPKDPNFVVYPNGTSRTVVDEVAGRKEEISLYDRKTMTTHLNSYVGAAQDYDAAHPEPKPWHDAKPGEVWELTTERIDDRWNPAAFTVGADGDYTKFIPAEPDYSISYLGLHATAITAGRRIWPNNNQD